MIDENKRLLACLSCVAYDQEQPYYQSKLQFNPANTQYWIPVPSLPPIPKIKTAYYPIWQLKWGEPQWYTQTLEDPESVTKKALVSFRKGYPETQPVPEQAIVCRYDVKHNDVMIWHKIGDKYEPLTHTTYQNALESAEQAQQQLKELRVQKDQIEQQYMEDLKSLFDKRITKDPDSMKLPLMTDEQKYRFISRVVTECANDAIKKYLS